MPDEPVADRPYMPGYGVPETLAGILTWSAARRRIETSRNYWLATLHPDGRPHVMPVWGVWMEGELYFSTGAESRKAKNLRADPRCTVSVEDPTQPIVIEGVARLVSDIDERWRMCVPYASKYDWPLHATEEGVTDAQGNGGPVFAVRPVTVIATSEDSFATATRWRFKS